MKTELEKMAPNMKAAERLNDVQVGLNEADAEAEDARQESRLAKDRYQDLKKKRCDLARATLILDVTCSTRPMDTCRGALIKCTRI